MRPNMFSYRLQLLTIFSFISSLQCSQHKMEAIQNQVMKIILSMKEMVQVLDSRFEYVIKENNRRFSDIKDLRE